MSAPRLDLTPLRLTLIALVGAALVLRPWIGAAEGSEAGLARGTSVTIRSDRDTGTGSLREAILDAHGAEGAVLIRVDVDSVVLSAPLPPLAAPGGVRLVAERDGVTLVLPRAGGEPALEVVSDGSLVEGITFAGPGSVCLRTTAPVVIRGAGFRDCSVGLSIGTGSDGSRAENNRFVGNEVGVRIEEGVGRAVVSGNRFERSSWAGVLGVGRASAATARAVRIEGNEFDGDRIGILLVNLPGLVRDNRVRSSSEAGIYLAGDGPLAERNRILGGAGAGILIEGGGRLEVRNNQVDGNATAGILVRSSRGSRVLGNRVHRNGYGILVQDGGAGEPVMVSANAAVSNRMDGIAVLSASPILNGNVLTANRQAGIRILELPGSRGAPSRPVLEGNRASDNGVDGPVRSVYGNR